MKIKLTSTIIFGIIIFFACQKKETISLPIVQTASVDQIFNTTARAGGQISSDGGSEITDRGIYWGTKPKPDSTGVKVQIGKGTGVFYDTLTGLKQGVKYYVKAYATNSQGTSYGTETFFTTQINLPTVTTSPVAQLTSTSAVIGGNITDDGGYKVTNRGLYWGILPNPLITGNKLDLDSGKGVFTYSLTGLNRAVTYYVMAYATNIKGTAYGSEISFSTQPELPTVSTAAVLNILAYSADVGGNVSSSGGATITERGVYWGTLPGTQTSGTKLIIGSGSGSFKNTLNKLNPAITYYVKAYAINSIGTSTGDELSFVTLGKAPNVSVLNFTNLSTSGVTLNALINANQLSTVVTFEYGVTSSYGSTIAASQSPATGTADTMSAALTGLSSNSIYHYRVKAVNDLSTVYSMDSTFKTVLTGITGTVQDVDGNSYSTIGIGYQVWMTENLRATKFNDNSSIPIVSADSSWNKLNTPAYSWYNNDAGTYKNTYGALYNWYTISTDNVCPSGWHVPTDDDFTTLINYLGGASTAGGTLKETGLAHWNSPNTGATNKLGFNALPGGIRYDNGNFDLLNVAGNWWSSTYYSTLSAKNLNLLNNYGNSFQVYTNKKYGMSVRCLKD